MKLISWNVNGIRAAISHGFWEQFSKFNADIVCLQEIKAFEHEIPNDMFCPANDYNLVTNSSKTPGRSGVAIYTKTRPVSITKIVNLDRFDTEGRFLKLEFPDFDLINLYLPHGGRDKLDLKYKLGVYDHLFNFLSNPFNKPLLLVGDFNIAHKEIDLARPRQNFDNIMFTTDERQKIDQLIELGFVDTFRMFNQSGGNYSWLSYLKNARERDDLGWRIDYAFVSKKHKTKISDAFILREVPGSDHVPIGIDFSPLI